MFGEHENCLFQNEKNVVLNENSVEGKPCINKESKSLEITIYLYSCYDEDESSSSCNTTENYTISRISSYARRCSDTKGANFLR